MGRGLMMQDFHSSKQLFCHAALCKKLHPGEFDKRAAQENLELTC